MIIGSHVSFNEEQLYGSLKEALSYNANALMFYTGAPQNTIRKEINEKYIDLYKNLAKEKNYDLNNTICHAPYIINLANNSALDRWDFSIKFLISEIKRCNMLGVNKIVIHPGSSVSLSCDEGINNIIEALKIIVNKTSDCDILIETMAGKGTECGKTIDEIKTIIDGVNSNRLKVCVDTCHINDAGYSVIDFDKYLDEFDKKIGINKIACIHLNDSKNVLASHKDRHENIGFGTIGFDALYNVLTNKRLINVPKILETPYINITDKIKKPPYKEEIKMLKENSFNSNIFKENDGI